MSDQNQYRKAVAIIVEWNTRILVGLKRYHNLPDVPDSWQFPQGGIENEEKPLDAAKRELKEETGINPDSLKWTDKETDWIRVSIPNTKQQSTHKSTIKFFHATAEIKPKITMCAEEFDGYQWMNINELLNMLGSMHFFKHYSYEMAAKYFGLIKSNNTMQNIKFNNLSLLCLHGFGENADVYKPFMDKIKPLISKSEAIDLPGHGINRDKKENNYFKDALEYIKEKIENTDTDTVVLVGTSYGGIVSYMLAAQQESISKRIILVINDVPKKLPCKLKRNLSRELIKMSDIHFDTSSLHEYLGTNGFYKDRQPISEDNWRHFLHSFIEQGKTKYNPDFFSNILNITTPEDLSPHVEIINHNNTSDPDQWFLKLDQKKSPLLLLIGERSTFFNQEDKYNFTHESEQQLVIKDAGHFIDLSRDDVFKSIVEFIDSQT